MWWYLNTETSRSKLLQHLREAPLDTRVWIGRGLPERTLQQNSHIHAIIGEVSRQTGLFPAAVKDLVKHEILGDNLLSGEPESTRKLSQEDAQDFIEMIYAWASEKGISLSLGTP
jgi:hypothetical protein